MVDTGFFIGILPKAHPTFWTIKNEETLGGPFQLSWGLGCVVYFFLVFFFNAAG